jgi:hypothetical protein
MSNVVTKYIERFLCVLTREAEIKVIQLDEVTAIDGVAVKSDQIGVASITDPKVSALLDAISAKTHADLVACQSALAAMTAERDSLQTQVDTIPGLTAQIESLTAAKAELESEVARLTALIPPPLPARSIYPRELLGRFTFAEVVSAIRTDDDAAIYAVANLQTTVAPINLDSDETRTLIGALVVAGIITSERLAEILA